MSITKTDADIVYITMTWYVTYTAGGFGTNGIYPVPRYNKLVSYLLQSTSSTTFDSTTWYASCFDMDYSDTIEKNYDINGTQSLLGEGNLSTMTMKVADVILGTTANNNKLVKTFGYSRIGAFHFPDPDIYQEQITDLVLGVGDGTTKDFSLICPHIKSGTLAVYIDDVLQTSGYTAEEDSNCNNDKLMYASAELTCENGVTYGNWPPKAGSYTILDPVCGFFTQYTGKANNVTVSSTYPIIVDFGVAKKCNRMFWNPGVSMSLSVLNNMGIEHSTDGITWVPVTNKTHDKTAAATSATWSFDMISARYWKITPTSSITAKLSTNSATASREPYFSLGMTDPGLHFVTAPAAGSQITADYVMDIPYKTANNAMALSVTLQLGRG